MKTILASAVVGLFVFGMSGSSLAQEKIVIAGSGDPQKLLRALGKAFEVANPGTYIEVPQSIGSTGGVKATAAGKADLGRVARALKTSEKGLGLTYLEFASAPVGYVVHPTVEFVDNLTRDEIVGIYSGRITHWKMLGGPPAKIYPVQREPGETSRGIIEEHFPEFGQTEWDVKTVYSTPEMVQALASHKFTIGYLSIPMVNGIDLNVLSVDGVAPTSQNIKAGRYPYVGPFAFVYKGELRGLAKRFVEFVKSPEGEKIIRDFGAIPQEDELR